MKKVLLSFSCSLNFIRRVNVKIPCENCITLPVCKSQVRKENIIADLRKLCKKCSIIDKYTNGAWFFWNIENRDKVLKLFGSWETST